MTGSLAVHTGIVCSPVLPGIDPGVIAKKGKGQPDHRGLDSGIGVDHHRIVFLQIPEELFSSD